MPGEPRDQHLSESEVAAYVDRQLSGFELADAEGHLTECAECRSEVIAVGRVIRGLRQRKRWAVAAPLAAAAVLVLLLLPWRRPSSDNPVLREPAVTTIVAPTPIAPRGRVAELSLIAWSSVPGATRYEVTVFDSVGTIAWEASGVDSTARVPHGALTPGRPYFWKVAARTAANRWVSSDLTGFSIEQTSAP